MRRYDFGMETFAGWYYLYCDSAGKPRRCSFISRHTGELSYVNIFMLPFLRVNNAWVNEPRGIKYLLWHHLRLRTDRAMLVYALYIPLDVQRVVVLNILRSINVITVLTHNMRGAHYF